MVIEERQTDREKREMQAYLPLGFWVLPWFVSIGVWKEGQQTAATVIVIVGNDEEAAHRNVAGFFCPLLCLPASNYYSCAAADSCGVYTVWGILSSFAASSWHESSSCISFVSWLGFASPSCGCVQGLGYPLFENKKTWNRLRNRNPPTAFSPSPPWPVKIHPVLEGETSILLPALVCWPWSPDTASCLLPLSSSLSVRATTLSSNLTTLGVPPPLTASS